MIIFRGHNFIFIKPEKTAGTSMRKMLAEICGEENFIEGFSPKTKAYIQSLRHQYRGLDSEEAENAFQKLLHDKKKKKFINKRIGTHSTIDFARTILGEGVWQHFFKWSIVRNPFDRIISAYVWTQSKPQRDMETGPIDIRNFTISNFRKWLLQTPGPNESIMEYYFNFNESDQPEKNPDGSYQKALDFYVRYEHFEEDLTALSQKLQLGKNLWEHFRKINIGSNIRPPSLTVQECFKGFPEGIALVEKLTKPLMTTFGYESPKA